VFAVICRVHLFSISLECEEIARSALSLVNSFLLPKISRNRDNTEVTENSKYAR
jgi:hypothetical protein